jgi:ATP-binding protein involved in chromosome partitioning
MSLREGISRVKNIILVSSGKGGVGKSTVTSNLAGALHRLGKTVGVLDADIHGPSQIMMFGLENDMPVRVDEEGKYMLPYEAHGIQVASMASRIKEGQTIDWRGPMAAMGVSNLFFHTNWSELDYLVVDMPPGTGDIQIAICDKVPQAKVVIVTTPQDVALIDCKKGIDLYQNKSIEILGIVENMAGHVCSHCGNVDYIFGSEGGDKLAGQYDLPLLGRLPLYSNIRKNSDRGLPIVLDQGQEELAQLYIDIAEKILDE